jgi:hypothetical protein
VIRRCSHEAMHRRSHSWKKRRHVWGPDLQRETATTTLSRLDGSHFRRREQKMGWVDLPREERPCAACKPPRGGTGCNCLWLSSYCDSTSEVEGLSCAVWLERLSELKRASLTSGSRVEETACRIGQRAATRSRWSSSEGM